MTLADYLSPEAFSRKMDGLCQKAAAARQGDDVPAVLVFPEELATFLGVLGREDVVAGAKTLEEAFGRIGRRLLLPLAGQMARYRTTSLQTAFFLLQAPRVWQTWYTTFRELARSYGVWIVAGSALLPENALGYDTSLFRAADRHIYNLSVTFDPVGRVANVTRKVNLVPVHEDGLGLSAGSPADWTGFAVENTAFANCICYDAFRVPHTAGEPGFRSLLREADDRGVKVVVQPSANPWWWDEPWVFGSGDNIPLRSQQWEGEGAASALKECRSVDVVVNSMLLASFLGLHFDGASAIYVRDEDGVRVAARVAASLAEPAAEELICYRYCTG
jgi:predicted amidohydrolase